MKPIKLLTTIFLLFNIISIAQVGEKLSDKTLLLNFNPSSHTFSFLADKKAKSAEEISGKQYFDVTGNYANIYINWLNPLKYKTTWTDTTIEDERDKLLKDFIAAAVVPFGSTVSELNTNNSKNIINKANKSRSAANKKNRAANETIIKQIEEKIKNKIKLTKSDSLTLNKANKEIKKDTITEIEGFQDLDLNHWYIDVLQAEQTLNSDDVAKINDVIKLITSFDKIDAVDDKNKIKKYFLVLFDLTAPTDVATIVKNQNDWIESRISTEGTYKNVENIGSGILTDLNDLVLEDKFISSYTKTIITEFVKKKIASFKTNIDLIEKLKPLHVLMKKSTTDSLPGNSAYIKLRSVRFDDGKKIETSLTITEYTYNAEKNIYEPAANGVYKTSLGFRRYSLFDIKASAGVFYSSATLKGFGTGENDNGEMIVKEDNINNNTAVTAAFVNFLIGDRYLSAIPLQIGIDPTKERPYLLLGGGVAIPVARFAITAGGIWTWQQDLDTLKTNDIIKSTLDLEKDVKYNFQMKPAGWYLDIQYNF
jgi:hypothetical protein